MGLGLRRIVCTYPPQEWKRKVVWPTVIEVVVIGSPVLYGCVLVGPKLGWLGASAFLVGAVFVAFILRGAFDSRRRAFFRRRMSFVLDAGRLQVIDQDGVTIQVLSKGDVLSTRSHGGFEWTKGDEPPTTFWVVEHRGGSFEFDERLSYARELRKFLGIEWVKAGKLIL